MEIIKVIAIAALCIYILIAIVIFLVMLFGVNNASIKDEMPSTLKTMSTLKLVLIILVTSVFWPVSFLLASNVAKKEELHEDDNVYEEPEPWFKKVIEENEKKEPFGGIFDISKMHSISDKDAEMLRKTREKKYKPFKEGTDEENS